MTFKAVTPVLLCLACAGMLGPAKAQSVHLTPPPHTATAATSVTTIQADYIVAVVNSEAVTNNEVRTRLIRLERRLAEQRVAMPPPADLMREVLEDVIGEKIQLQRARESGLKVDDRAVEAAVQNFANQNKISVADLRTRRISADGIGFTQIRTDIANQLLIQKLREREILGRVNIPDSEVDLFLREQFGAAESGPQNINLAQILIAVPESSTASQIQVLRERAERILARARAGDDFFKLAQENSEATDASAGGQMGLRSADRYPTLFSEATQDLKEGGLAGPIRSGAGFHILKVLAKQGNNANFNITQTKVRHILLRTGPQLSEAAAKATLAGYKKRMEAGTADFATLAKDHSQDGSATEGGSLGWAGPGQFVPEFEKVMNQLAPGKISDPLVSRFGVHLILVEERRQNQLSVTEQRELARNALREKKLDEAYANWVRDLRSNAYVEYREPPQ